MKLAVGLVAALAGGLGTWDQGPWRDPGPPVARADVLLGYFETMCLQTRGQVRSAESAAEQAGWQPLNEDEGGFSTYSPVVQHPRAAGVYFPSHLTLWDDPEETRCEVGTTGGPDDGALLAAEAERRLELELRPIDEDTPGDCQGAAWENGAIQVCYFQGVEGGGFDIALVVPKESAAGEAATR